MSYLIYNTKTTAIVTERAFGTRYYATESAAKAAVTRFAKKGVVSKDEVAVVEDDYYFENIEAKVKRVNMMTGLEYYESVNTPGYCSPSSESYWSM